MPPYSPDQWKDKGSYFHHKDHPVFYVDEGQGPVIVLIHGFPTSSFDWSYIWDGLGDYRRIAPDLMGFGFSAKPTSYHYSISDQASLVEGMLEQLGIAEYQILAHDYGDTVAQELLARHRMRKHRLEPGKETTIQSTESWPDVGTQSVIRSCCLLNGGLFPEVHRPRTIQKLLIGPFGSIVARLINKSKFEKSFAEIFGKNSRPSQQELDYFWLLIETNHGTRIYHKLIRYMQERKQFRTRWVEPLQKGDVPLRLINGPDDPVSGKHMAERYRELVPEADIVLLEGIGHYPQTEAPQQVLNAYLEFLRAVG